MAQLCGECLLERTYEDASSKCQGNRADINQPIPVHVHQECKPAISICDVLHVVHLECVHLFHSKLRRNW